MSVLLSKSHVWGSSGVKMPLLLNESKVLGGPHGVLK